MKPEDRVLHVRGESRFIDDLPLPDGCLHAAVLGSPRAHGRIRRLDVQRARRRAGVVAVLTREDIPGENQIGPILPDEPLLAEGEVHHVGQAVALVLAVDASTAREALAEIRLEIDPLPALLDAREAAAAGELLQPARTFAIGDVDSVWSDCAIVVEGRVETGAQEHFYLETQCATAEPREDGTLHILSSTQSPTGVQRQTARVLGLPMHAIEVDVRRLGGAFGGKEDQATPWAALCALGAHVTGRSVHLSLDRREDLSFTGKRHPYSSDYRLGLDDEGRMLAYEVTFYQNAGASADLSTAILERSLFHATGSYHVPHVRATGLSCRTHLPPFTAFRGFGGPQATAVIEAAVDRAARRLGRPRHELQRRNLLDEGDVFPFGMVAEECRARRCFDEAVARHELAGRWQAVEEHNREDPQFKKGLAVTPICFGISFTNTSLNQARALVHLYHDGSVAVSTGAVEMGQGVGRKIALVAARTLGVDEERVRIVTTNTSRVANTSPTAASTGADMNGAATRLACLQILERLRGLAARLLDAPVEEIEIRDDVVHLRGERSELGFEELVSRAFLERVDLSAHAHFATPDIGFDRRSEQGRPFAYHVYGTALTEVTLDALRGVATVDRVSIVHDVGRSLDLLTDRGQVEGALVQGLGWMLLEDIRYDEDGRLVHADPSRAKVPDLHFAPDAIEVHFLEDADNPRAVLSSKAVGEPPFLYGIGAGIALLDALRAARPDLEPALEAPLTPERLLQHLCTPVTEEMDSR